MISEVDQTAVEPRMKPLVSITEARATGRLAAARVAGREAVAAVQAATPSPRVHLPALDGIRGLAVLLVMAFHFMLLAGDSSAVRLLQKVCGMGWMGVDLFFVLSGFLITGILLDAKRANDRSAGLYFKSFYARRTVRIFPLYYAFLVLFLLVLPRVVPNFHALFGYPPCADWPYWTYTYNIFQGKHQGVDIFSHSLGVTWSLCIEEQFYVLWPTVVWFCKPRTLLKICGGLIAMSMISRAVVMLSSGNEIMTAQLSLCRMDALAIGAALAVAVRHHFTVINSRAMRRSAWAAMLTIPTVVLVMNICGGSLINIPAFQITGYALFAIMFGATILLTITSPASAPLQRFFSNPMLRTFGKISYAMYLFNQPVKVVLREYVLDPNKAFALVGSRIPAQLLFFVLGTVATFGVAWLSWHLFEKHFLKLKDWFPMESPEPANGTPQPVSATAGLRQSAA
jgi:peptidoglycan/LPS O-acetylase OafA/YrhL